jgi:hypothetical protein
MIKPGITAIAAGAILAVVVSACGGGGTSAPQTASQILTSNGYIPVPASQSSEVAMILGGGPPASDFSSVAVGVSARDGLGKDSSGTSTYQEVMVLTPAGVSAVSPTFAASQSQDKAVGATLTLHGDVLTGTGTGNAISELSQG